MGIVFIFGLIFLLIFLSIGIGLFIYSRKKKSKIGLTISIIMFCLVVRILLINTIDEFSISKKDVISDLNYVNIVLKDDFKITDNYVAGFPERIQETEIQITQKDKDRIVSEIRNSANFRSFANDSELGERMDYGIGEIVNFKFTDFYSREAYLEIGIPTRFFISIYDNSNTIQYQIVTD